MKKVNSPAGEGSPIVPRYNFATGEYMNPNYYGEDTSRIANMSGLDTEINNRNTRMNRKGYAPVPNYMIGNGNSPMHRGGNNLLPSPQQGFEYLTTGGYPPPSAMPQNANVYPAMFNHETGERIDPQSGGLVPHIDKHSSSLELSAPMFSGVPSYLQGTSSEYGSLSYRDVNGSGGYKYRQFSDGSIQILKSPTGATGTMVQKGSSAWQAITNQIGQYPSASSSIIPQTGREGLDQVLQSEQAQNVFMSLFDRFVTGQSAKTEQLELQKQQALLDQQRIQEQMKPSLWDQSKPYLIGLGLIGGVGGLVYVLTKPKKK